MWFVGRRRFVNLHSTRSSISTIGILKYITRKLFDCDSRPCDVRGCPGLCAINEIHRSSGEFLCGDFDLGYLIWMILWCAEQLDSNSSTSHDQPYANNDRPCYRCAQSACDITTSAGKNICAAAVCNDTEASSLRHCQNGCTRSTSCTRRTDNSLTLAGCIRANDVCWFLRMSRKSNCTKDNYGN